MTELSDTHFQTLLNAIERGDALPVAIPSNDAADLAMAEKLFKLKAQPSQALMTAVERLSRQSALPAVKTRRFVLPKTFRRMAVGAALAGALLLSALVLYPPTRQAMAQAIDTITFGMITVVLEENDPTEAVGPGTVIESYSSLWIPGNLEELQADYPNLVTLPAVIPDGYVQQELIGLFINGTYDEQPSVVVHQWKNAQGDWLQFEIYDATCPEGYTSFGKESCGGHLYISSSSPVFVSINGQQGVGRTGSSIDDFSGEIRRWNARHYRIYETGSSLYWEHNKALYILRVTSNNISQEELVRIAESIP